MPITTKRMDTGSVENFSTPKPCPDCSRWGVNDFGKKIILTLMGVLLVYLVFYVGTLTRNNIKDYEYIGLANQLERTITVTGYGKVTGNNDIAVTTIGYSNTDPDVAKAQADNKKVMDAVVVDLKKMGVADKDLQSDYSIYPDYNYTQQQGQVFKGYRVSNNMTVKIRDLSKISDILSLAGKYGATQVSGLNFTIDDPENLKIAARNKALVDAQNKVDSLAKELGVRVVEVVSYNEYDAQDNPTPYPMMRADVAAPLGVGGAGPAPESIGTGSRDVAMNVSVTYKIVPRYTY